MQQNDAMVLSKVEYPLVQKGIVYVVKIGFAKQYPLMQVIKIKDIESLYGLMSAISSVVSCCDKSFLN